MKIRKSLLLLFFLSGMLAHSQSVLPGTADNNRTAIRTSVSATAEQLSGKWNISKILNPKHIEFPADKVQGSYFIFGDDKTYSATIMGVEEKGTWQFGPENKSIHMFVNGMKTIWNILAVSATELVIQKGVRGNTVTFTR